MPQCGSLKFWIRPDPRKMDKPLVQPTEDLIALTKIGPIMAFTYDREKSRDNKNEAESEAHGHYTYDCVLHVRGYGVDGLHLETYITETTFIKFVEIGTDINEYGFWRVTKEGHAIVHDWGKWVNKEARDLKEYERLTRKFGGVNVTLAVDTLPDKDKMIYDSEIKEGKHND